jgi:hypothetical protein
MRVRCDGGKILLHIPRATAFGIAQARHDRQQVVEAVACGVSHLWLFNGYGRIC